MAVGRRSISRVAAEQLTLPPVPLTRIDALGGLKPAPLTGIEALGSL